MPDQPPPVALDALTTTTPPRGNVPVERVPARLGIVPTTVEEAWRLATMMAKSELVPKSYRGKPEDVIVAVQMGAEVGLAPMQAIQSIAVIIGRPSLWGDGLLALVMSAAAYQDHQEFFVVAGVPVETLTTEDLKNDATAAVCTVERRGKATPVTRSFSIAQAKRANLLGKDGPWKDYPSRMLQMRARALALRDAFPDVLRGIAAAEEWQDVPPSVEAPTPVVRRMSERALRPTLTEPVIAAYTSTPPVRVTAVTPNLGGAVVLFGDGREAWADDPRLAGELGELVGTDHRVVVDLDQSARVLRVDVVE